MEFTFVSTRRSLQNIVPVLTLISALGLTACSDGGSKGAGNRIVPAQGPADYTGCAIQPEVGEKASIDKATQDDVVVSSFFNKKYDRADLSAVASASALSTAAYVKALSVQLYKVPRENVSQQGQAGACTTYYGLDLPRKELKAQWDQISGGANGGGQLAGLYFEDCKDDCSERKLIRPTIMVDEQGDRWTLVHEMMHHNFNVQRKVDMSLPTRNELVDFLNGHINQFNRTKQTYQRSPNSDLLMQMALNTHQIALGLNELLVRSSFEEMAVEGILVDTWAAGNLKYVTRQSAESAVWYMNYSRDSAMKTMDELRTEFLDFVLQEARTRGWANPYQKASETDRYLNSISQQTAEIIEQAQSKVRAQLNDIGMLAAETKDSSMINSAYVTLTRASHLDHHGEGRELLAAWEAMVSMNRETNN